MTKVQTWLIDFYSICKENIPLSVNGITVFKMPLGEKSKDLLTDIYFVSFVNTKMKVSKQLP